MLPKNHCLFQLKNTQYNNKKETEVVKVIPGINTVHIYTYV